jgi:hypothetical protein
MKPRAKIWLSLLAIWAYAGWFFCVLLGQKNLGAYSLIGPVLTWLLFFRALNPKGNLCLKLLIAAAIGFSFDAAAIRLHWIFLKDGSVLPPFWLLALWLHFAPSISLLSSLLQNRLWLGALAGAVMGPLSYKSGEAFDLLRFSGTPAVFIYTFFWASFIPAAMLWLKERNPQHGNS